MVRQLLTAIIQINNHFNGIGSIYLINVSHLWGACNWYSYEYCTGVELQERKQMSAYAFNNNKAQRRQSTPSLQTHTHQNVHWETACLQALWRLSVTITHSHTPHCECVWESLCLVSSPGSRVAAKVYGHFWKSNKATEPSFPRGRRRRREEPFLCSSSRLRSVFMPASDPKPMSLCLCPRCSFLPSLKLCLLKFLISS